LVNFLVYQQIFGSVYKSAGISIRRSKLKLPSLRQFMLFISIKIWPN